MGDRRLGSREKKSRRMVEQPHPAMKGYHLLRKKERKNTQSKTWWCSSQISKGNEPPLVTTTAKCMRSHLHTSITTSNSTTTHQIHTGHLPSHHKPRPRMAQLIDSCFCCSSVRCSQSGAGNRNIANC